MAALYTPNDCAKKVKRIVLHPRNKQIVDEFVTIVSMKDEFEKHDVPVPNKVVMFGPPGTGKTLTAFYIAQQLQIPLVLVRLDAIIHSHLGETGTNVRKIFDYAHSTRCVLFLDEFDAIARTRINKEEVKEMTRVVNTLLQCLDEFDSTSIFVAATNLEEDLDRAVWRRFDTKMRFDLPDDAARHEYVRLLIGEFAHETGLVERTSELLQGISFADIEQIMVKAKRKAIIEGSELSYTKMLASLEEYKP